MRTQRYRCIVPVGPGKLLPARTVWRQTPTAAFSFLLSAEGESAKASPKEIAERIVSKFSAGLGLTGSVSVAFARTFAEPAKLHCFVQFICTMNAGEWFETQNTFVREVMENLSHGVEGEAHPPIFDDAMSWMLTKHAQEPTNASGLRQCGFGVAMQTLISSAYEVVAHMNRGGRATQYDLISTRILLLHLFVSSCWHSWRARIYELTLAILEASTVRAAETRKGQSVSLHFDRMFESASRKTDVDNRWTAITHPRKGRQAIRYLKKQFRSRGFGDVAALYVFIDCGCRNRVSMTDMAVSFQKLQIPENAVDLRSVFALSRVAEGSTRVEETQLSEMAFIRLFSSGHALQTKGKELLLLGKPFFQAVAEARRNQKHIITTVMENVNAMKSQSCEDAESISSGESGPTVLLQSLHRWTPSWSIAPSTHRSMLSGRSNQSNHSTSSDQMPFSTPHMPARPRPWSASSSASRASFQRTLALSRPSSAASARQIARSDTMSETHASAAVGFERCAFCGGMHVLQNDQAPSTAAATEPQSSDSATPNRPVFAARAPPRLSKSEPEPQAARRLHMSDSDSDSRAKTPDSQARIPLAGPPSTDLFQVGASVHRPGPAGAAGHGDGQCDSGRGESEAERSGSACYDNISPTTVTPSRRPTTASRSPRAGRPVESNLNPNAPGPNTPRRWPGGESSRLRLSWSRAGSSRRARRQKEQLEEGSVDGAMEMLSLVLELDISRRFHWGRGLDRSFLQPSPRSPRVRAGSER